MKTIVYIATSLDGYIARKDGSIDWLNDVETLPKEDYGYAEFMNRIDAIVMGRSTYETALTFGGWPYTKRVFVLSTTLKSIPDKLRKKVTLLSAEPGEVLKRLSVEGFSTIYVDGGKTIQSFLKADLIDELIITRIPLLLGSGIPLFGNLEHDLHFLHIQTASYPNGLVKSHYAKKVP